jgi:hypothetical protein
MRQAGGRGRPRSNSPGPARRRPVAESSVPAGPGLADTIRSTQSEVLLGGIPLLLLASAYVASDASGMRWPGDVVLREIAENASRSATHLDVTGEEIFRYLSRAALGPEKLDDVFSDEGLITIPLYATANLLLPGGAGRPPWKQGGLPCGGDRLPDRGGEGRPCPGGEGDRAAVAVGGVADEDHAVLADFDAAAAVA